MFNEEQFTAFAGEDDAERKDMAALFIEQIREYCRDLSMAFKANDQEAWEMAAHKMKGMSSFVGTMRLHNVCLKAEHAMHALPIEKEKLLKAVQTEMEAAIKALNDYLGNKG